MLNSISRDLTLGMHIEEDRVKMEREKKKENVELTYCRCQRQQSSFVGVRFRGLGFGVFTRGGGVSVAFKLRRGCQGGCWSGNSGGRDGSRTGRRWHYPLEQLEMAGGGGRDIN